MRELKKLIQQVIQEICEISDYLYQQKTAKGYEALNGTLEKIMNIADRLFSISGNNPDFFDGPTLVESLSFAMKAMEEKDSVLLADILVYEIAGQLQEIESSIA